MPSNLSLSKVFNPQAGWYQGDFHAHTNFSDGVHSPADLVDVARSEGLDFFAITDHNTIEAYAKFGEVPDILIIPGIEITLKEGHYNVFGLAGDFDWLSDVCVWPAPLSHLTGHYNTPTKLMHRAAEQGLLNSINHPLLPPWDWLDYEAALRNVHCLEIWNDPSWPDNKWANPQAVDMWTRWLNAGYRITALGGSDYHRPQPKPGEDKPAERLGLPRTWVYAEELSGAAILAGVVEHRIYVTMGPQVTFQADVNGTSYGIGADLGKVEGTIEFKATVSHQFPVQAQLIKSGDVMAQVSLKEGSGPLQYTENLTPPDSAWYRFDVLDPNRQILAVTNPIFVGPSRKPSALMYGDFIENHTKTAIGK